MLRFAARCGGLLTLIFVLITPAFSKTVLPNNDDRNSGDALSANSADTTPAPVPQPPADATAPAQQATGSEKKDASAEYKPAPKFTPMLATTGTLGFFTLETADTLPKHGFAFSAFGNKFGRMPGSVTLFQVGIDASYGITDNLNVYATFDPYSHVHVGCPGQLSLRSIPLAGACAPVAFGSSTPGSFFPVVAGSAPGYVEDYPFAANNTGGIGNITLGVKYALMNQREGAHVGLSLRNDLIISTKTDVNKLLANGTQGSPLSDLVSIAVSRQWGNILTGTFNFGYMFVRAPRDNNDNHLFDMANQLKTGAGILLFPESRFQPMMEYSAIVFDSAPNSPDNTTLGARDPIDGIWGLRMYLNKNIGVDLGYRYMLNLRNSSDRSGFVVKIGTAYWPEKAPPVNHPRTIACTADKPMVYADSNDAVAISCTASDPDNDPLTYTWSSTAGKVDGSGPQVRWLSKDVTVGSSSITAKVDDERGGSAASTVSVSVETKPNHPPTIMCFADRSTVFAGEKGIDASRVTTKTGGGQAGATDNRHIDVIWVPEGATY